MLDGLVHGLGAGPHQYDHPLGIRGPDIVEQRVPTSGEFAETIHRVLHDAGEGIVVGIGALARLEEHVRILRGTTQHRMLRRKRACPMRCHEAVIDHRAHGFLIDRSDFCHLVRGAETIEEMDHGDASRQGRRLRDHRKVLCLLRGIGGKHGATGGAAGHDVGLVAEDGQCVRRQRARRNMQYEGRQLAGDLVEVGNHQQQALAGREAGRQRAGGECAMQCPGGTAFRLHLDDFRHCPPQVGPALRGPFVRPFAHAGCRGDGIDRDHLVAKVGHAGNGFVAVNGECRGHKGLLQDNSVLYSRRDARMDQPPR